METPIHRSKLRYLWFVVLLVLLALCFGGYVWYENNLDKYDRITNATAV